MHGEGLSLHPATARVRSEVVQVANMLPAALTYWLKKKKKKKKISCLLLPPTQEASTPRHAREASALV